MRPHREPLCTNGSSSGTGHAHPIRPICALGSAHMMRDFTLVIPTYNRAQQLAALLSYLETEKADCRVLVLDSSRPEVLAANRERVAASSLDVEFAEFADLEPDRKVASGHSQSHNTVLRAVRGRRPRDPGRCAALSRHPQEQSLGLGGAGLFFHLPAATRRRHGIEQYRVFPTDHRRPFAAGAPHKLFQQYQALNYGVFRTPTLQRILDALQPMTQTLARELLWSALTAISGHVIRLPHFSYGRSMGPSAAYDYWHPLEWLCKDPDSLFAEYLRYRELTAAAIIKRADNEHQLDEIHDMLDLIHLRYLARHVPDSAVEFIAEQQISGANFAEYWPRHEIHLPLYEAAGIRPSPELEKLGPLSIRGPERSYHLFPNFYAPRGIDSPQMADIVRLINVLDGYRAVVRATVPPKARREPHRYR